MAWIERTEKRTQKAKHYQDSENPSRCRAGCLFCAAASTAAWILIVYLLR